jgi:3-hydroxyisobutyrate dehydrogenase-like beta-hydroxyacid dehydrogenase
MGKHVVHVGEQPRAGQAAKYCLNLSQAVVLQGVLEGYALAKTLGIPLAALAEIFEHSAGKTGVGTFKTPYLLRGELDDPHFRLDLMAKDLHLGLGEAQARRVPLPAAQTVRLLYDQAVAEGLGDRDFLATARLLERWIGAPLRDAEPAIAGGDRPGDDGGGGERA